MATWPGTLPQEVLANVTRTRQQGRIRSQMETGPAKQRNRFTAVVKNYDAQIIVTGAQLTTFNTFYEDTLGNGTDSFTWVDPFTDAAQTLRFREEPQETLMKPDSTPNNRLYMVTLPLEVLP